jgi:hypothetical protein
MKDLIKKILLEQSWNDSDHEPIPDKILDKFYKFIDKVGPADALPLLHIDDAKRQHDIIMSYYNDYGGNWSSELPITFNAENISTLFPSDVEEIAEKYLKNEYEYDGHYECYDYDHYWMWDSIDEENQKLILDKVKEDVVDIDDEDEVIDMIRTEFGSDIGCAFADAQHDADINYLHSEISEQVDEFLQNFKGTWDYESGEFHGTIEFSDLIRSEYFSELLESELEDSMVLDLDYLMVQVIEKEFDEIQTGWVGTTDIFPHEIYLDVDKHFRYGGAGDMDITYMNDILTDRLSWI